MKPSTDFRGWQPMNREAVERGRLARFGPAKTKGVCGSPITPELSNVQSGQDSRAPVHGACAVQKGTGGFPRWVALGGLVLESFAPRGAEAAQPVKLDSSPSEIRLSVATQTWRFRQVRGRWTLEDIAVRGSPVARPLSPADSFFVGEAARRHGWTW